MNKKLIEVAIPLDAINEASAREKSIRHGHPSTLHLWWARRPLATARAVLFASLVDDPSSHPDQFPSEGEQDLERKRLFSLLIKLVQWENTCNNTIINEAKAEIVKYMGSAPIEFLDPFSGGGAIPLEAQRLGLSVHAHDLNPVSVMINKSMVEIPYQLIGIGPINPKSRSNKILDAYVGLQGFVDDLVYYGAMLKKLTFDLVGINYPKTIIEEDGVEKEANVLAWLWARTVKCSNPACNCTIPLVRSFTISKKQNVSIKPIINGNKIEYSVEYGKENEEIGTITAKGAVCLKCGTLVSFDEIKKQAEIGKMSHDLMACVVEGDRKRIYQSPSPNQKMAANINYSMMNDIEIDSTNVRDIRPPKYGMTHYSNLFTNRQLLTINTFVDNIKKVRDQAEADAKAAGLLSEVELIEGGSGFVAYGEAISVYLSFVVSKLVDYHSTICSWHSSKELIRNTFGRQAISMIWDYAEGNPFCNSTGCFDNMLEWVVRCIPSLPANKGEASQFNAMEDSKLRGVVVSTDPPYYDNIGYADLSDYFYIWMRGSLKTIYPNLFSTMLVPKNDELVAMRYRFGGNTDKAKSFFENGMFEAFKQIFMCTREDVPVTIYYAFKQSESEYIESTVQTSSSGWETMLSAIIRAGFIITGTWPVRTELSNRLIGNNANALSSSIVLVCRKRSESARITRREFVLELRNNVRSSLKKMQDSNIAPVDFAQSAIGPGISVFSKYDAVMESDGSSMTVRSALQIINQELDTYITEQEGNLDSASRFCVDLYTQYAFNDVKYGEAEVLARAKNTSIDGLSDRGPLYSEKGIVRLLTRDEQPSTSKVTCTWSLCQQLTYLLETSGIDECAKLLVQYPGSLPEDAKALAYRLYSIAERKKWTQEAYAYNNLIVAWPDIQVRLMKLIDPASGKHSVGLDRWS